MVVVSLLRREHEMRKEAEARGVGGVGLFNCTLPLVGPFVSSGPGFQFRWAATWHFTESKVLFFSFNYRDTAKSSLNYKIGYLDLRTIDPV